MQVDNQDDKLVRQQLLALLRGGNAHMGLDQAVADFPPEAFNRRPPNTPYTPWQILEHIRITQWDILEFIRNPEHELPDWPEGYWPSPEINADQEQWGQTLASFRADLRALQEIVADPETDLYAPMPQGERYTILREILVVSDHNAYHIGEFAVLRQVMGTWPADRNP